MHAINTHIESEDGLYTHKFHILLNAIDRTCDNFSPKIDVIRPYRIETCPSYESLISNKGILQFKNL